MCFCIGTQVRMMYVYGGEYVFNCTVCVYIYIYIYSIYIYIYILILVFSKDA